MSLRHLIALAPCRLVALLTCLLPAPAARAVEPRHFDDAALRAVQFVDVNEGWAAGDEGVVWHTIDGGRTWERQPTGVRAALRSIHFLNPYTGWIAGREELPHQGGSSGVLLATHDGGLHWRRVGTNALPGLNQVRFLDGKTGFAAGDGSDQFPSGVFQTTDAGRTWKPVPGPRCPAWLAADFQDAQTGALAGAWSKLAALRQGVLGKADLDQFGGRAVHALQVIGKRAVAVGQGGLVLLSRDSAGERWGFGASQLPTEVRASWDFHAVYCLGDHVWAAGRPGSAILHSADRGQSWETLTTGQPLPLNGIFFIDEKQGWAVGELGEVLATRDGGKTWQVQRRGGQRSAILFVHARAGGLPLDTVALTGAVDGYLAAAVRVTAPDSASARPDQAADPQRLAAALRQAGGAAGEVLWQFPVPQHLAGADRPQLLQAWNRLHDDRAAEELVRQLVLALRIWRPEVVVTDPPGSQAGATPDEALVAEAVHEAFQRAADPGAFPEQIRQLGLETWEVRKLYCRWEGKAAPQVTLNLTDIHARLEGGARDYAAPAAALLADRPVSLPAQRHYRLVASRLPDASKHVHLMQGINLAPGGTAQRPLSEVAELAPELEKALRARRNLQALAEAPADGLLDPNKVLAQIRPALNDLPDDKGAAAAFAVGSHFARGGQWALAREVFLSLVDRYPAHPLSVDAYRWLIRHNTSGEARRRQEMGQFLVTTHTEFRQAAEEPKRDRPGVTEKVSNRQLTELGSLADTRKWYEGSLLLGTRLDAFGALYATEPATQFCLQAARRHLAEFDAAKDWYARFCKDHRDGPYRAAAAAELWLLNRQGLPPRPAAMCRQTAARPFLDGNFDDPCWQDLPPLVLTNAVGDTTKDYGTDARLAYDKDFLYLALRCRHPAGGQVSPAQERPRDADLQAHDRVSLLLDLDRDYATYFHLEVDRRGCVREDCWGDRSWDPRWFVAVKSDADGWRIEAAIPMAELTSDLVTPGRAWACNVVRTLPGRGVQAWSLPADVQPRPEGMGLLLFAAGPRDRR